jgi:N-acetylglucosamine kinase-like BadF-type ATPase
MGERSIVLGLDGGSTKTLCVAIAVPDPDKTDFTPAVVGRGISGSSNWNSVGVDTAHTHFIEAIRAAVADAGCTLEQTAAVCVGMSGVDRPYDRAQVQHWLQELVPSTHAYIHNDAVIALASGTGGRLYGIVAISGTGMIALGFNQQGQRARAGGWGALLGDGGSGYAIGSAVLRAVTHAVDGCGPATALVEAVLQQLKLERPEELIRWAYDDIAWHRFAQLAPLAVTLSGQGDPVARAIIEQAADEIADAIGAVTRKLGMTESTLPLVLTGSNLRPGVLAEAVVERVRYEVPYAHVIHPAQEPAMGAALLALSSLHEQGH